MFHKALERLREAAQDNRQRSRDAGTKRVVEVRDLQELLYHFDRLDAEARMGYPPNINELANAAEKAVPQLPSGDVKLDLEYALSLVRPVSK